MTSFTKPLIVEVLENGRYYRVNEAFVYFRTDNTQILIEIPKGFVTDFASVPRIFWSILPPFGTYSKACVLHDYLCTLNKTNSVDNNGIKYTRKECDLIFLEAMEAVQVKKIVRYTLYYAVRLYAVAKRLR